jgi:hypothetical protein
VVVQLWLVGVQKIGNPIVSTKQLPDQTPRHLHITSLSEWVLSRVHATPTMRASEKWRPDNDASHKSHIRGEDVYPWATKLEFWPPEK